MQYIFFIIFLSLLAFDLRKGIIIYAPFKLFFLLGIKIIGSVSFDACFSIIAVFSYIATYHAHLRNCKIPWRRGLLIGIVLSVVNGVLPELNGPVIWRVFTIFLYTVIFYDSINSRSNFKLAIYCIILFVLLICINGVIEYQVGVNYLREIQQSISEKNTYFSDNAIERFGITHRVCSCIPHAIGFGTVCACLFLLFFYIIYETTFHIDIVIIGILLVLLGTGIVLSASRSPLLGMAVMAIPFVINKDVLNMKNFIIVGLLFLVAVYFVGDFLYLMFISMVNEDVGLEARGSALEMRETQLELTMMLWSHNPIFGNGNIVLEQIDRSGMLRGAESLWFQLLIRRGLVGFVGYILFFFSIFVDIYHTQKERVFKMFFWSGWIVINTVTSLPGLTDFFALMILSLMYKLEEFGFVNWRIAKK